MVIESAVFSLITGIDGPPNQRSEIVVVPTIHKKVPKFRAQALVLRRNRRVYPWEPVRRLRVDICLLVGLMPIVVVVCFVVKEPYSSPLFILGTAIMMVMIIGIRGTVAEVPFSFSIDIFFVGIHFHSCNVLVLYVACFTLFFEALRKHQSKRFRTSGFGCACTYLLTTYYCTRLQ